jgi:hypothetical protein
MSSFFVLIMLGMWAAVRRRAYRPDDFIMMTLEIGLKRTSDHEKSMVLALALRRSPIYIAPVYRLISIMPAR